MKKQLNKSQRKIKKVMHEFKEGELRSGRNGKGGRVKTRKQAIAIALSEAGKSRRKILSPKKISS